MPVTHSVPVIACTAPPPSPTTLRIELVKKATSNRFRPLPMVAMTRETSGSRARTKALVTTIRASRSLARRVPSTRAESTTMTSVKRTAPTMRVRMRPNEPRTTKRVADSSMATVSAIPVVHEGSFPAVSLFGSPGGDGGAHQLAPENSLRRLMMARAIMLTARVITNRTRPVAISWLTPRPYASGKLRAMLAAMVLGFWDCSKREGDDRRRRQHHGHRHRLTEGATQTQHAGRHDAGPGEGEDRHLDHLPAGGPERQRRLLVQTRGLQEHLAGQRGDDRQDHHREDHGHREDRAAGARRGAGEQRDEAE